LLLAIVLGTAIMVPDPVFGDQLYFWSGEFSGVDRFCGAVALSMLSYSKS
jgi:hypothetical protein